MQFICTEKKVASLNPWHQNARWRDPLTDSTVTKPKYVQIPLFLHILRAHAQGQICIYGFVGKIYLGKKFLRFLNFNNGDKKTENNRFRVPIHFATNRFIF